MYCSLGGRTIWLEHSNLKLLFIELVLNNINYSEVIEVI